MRSRKVPTVSVGIFIWKTIYRYSEIMGSGHLKFQKVETMQSERGGKCRHDGTYFYVCTHQTYHPLG